MKKGKKAVWGAVCLAALIFGVLVFGPVTARLPVDPQGSMLARETPPWTGVCQIWLCETFYPGRGSFLKWLEKSAEAYEKTSGGIKINVRTVTPQMLADSLQSGEGLPDAVVGGMGLFEDPSRLQTVSPGKARDVFADAVSQDGQCRGVPLAAGAYTVIWRSERLTQAGLDAAVTAQDLDKLVVQGKKATSYALSCPKTEFIAPSCALAAMFDPPAEQQGALSPDFCRVSNQTGWADFVLDGDFAGYAATQKEVFRIRQLEAGGNAFAWETTQLPCPYTDQLLAMYVLSGCAPEKSAALCRFAETVQSAERQGALADVGAFAVVELPAPLYPQGSAMAVMERSLEGETLTVVNTFAWYEQHQQLMQAEQSAADASGALAAAKALLRAAGRP